MKLLTLAAACAVVATLSAAPAFAQEPVVAKLAQPVGSYTKLIAGSAVFKCEGDTCIASAPTSQTFSGAACKDVAAKVGVIVSYTGDKAMDETRLEACNSIAIAKAAGGQRLAGK